MHYLKYCSCCLCKSSVAVVGIVRTVADVQMLVEIQFYRSRYREVRNMQELCTMRLLVVVVVVVVVVCKRRVTIRTVHVFVYDD